jgi:hypothetical protein
MKIDSGIAHVEKRIVLLTVAAIMVSVTAQMFMRYVTDTRRLLSDEGVAVLMVATVLFGILGVDWRNLPADLLGGATRATMFPPAFCRASVR